MQEILYERGRSRKQEKLVNCELGAACHWTAGRAGRRPDSQLIPPEMSAKREQSERQSRGDI